jgi:tight adherence protein B
MTLLLPGLLLIGLLLILGVGLSLVLREVRRTRLERERHAALIGGGGSGTTLAGAAGAALPQETGWRALLGTHMRAIFAVNLPRSWGMIAGAPTLLLTGVAGSGAGWFAFHVGLHMSDWIVLAGIVAGFFLAPRTLLKRQQTGADQKFMEVFPDTIDMVIRMLRAGLPITAAVRAVGDEAPAPVNAVFTTLADQMAIGITFEDALAAAGERVNLTDFQFFAIAVSLQRTTGGNLAATLEILSDLMRKRRAMRLKAKATPGEVRMSAYVLGAIPFLIIGGLLVMTPDYLAPLISDRRGKIIIAAAVTSLLAGFAIIRQMMRSVTHVA